MRVMEFRETYHSRLKQTGCANLIVLNQKNSAFWTAVCLEGLPSALNIQYSALNIQSMWKTTGSGKPSTSLVLSLVPLCYNSGRLGQ